MTEFELPDGRSVRISDRVLEQADSDHLDCAFCLGRAAAHVGDQSETNPFTAPDAKPGSVDWYESDYGLWREGHHVGRAEPGGLLWFEQPSFDAES
jgi:hypothetical protein